jgi:hypothetical protein
MAIDHHDNPEQPRKCLLCSKTITRGTLCRNCQEDS